MVAPPDNPPDDGTPSKGTTIDDLSSRFMAVAATAGAKTMQRFVIKLQYKPPTTAAPGDARGHLSTVATVFLSKVKLTHADDVSFVSLANDTLIDLQSMPTKTDANCEEMFKVVHRPNAYRSVELWIKLETALSFSAVKSPMFDFLREQDYWLDLHGFGVQVTKIMRIGYVIDLEPRHIFREDYQTSVNNEIAAQLRKLPPPDRTALYKKHRCANTDSDRPTPKIRIILANNLSHPSDKSSTPATTRALAVECPFEDRNMIEYYMMKFSRHPSCYFGKFINVSMTKQSDFVPQFRTLIASHNKRLTSHRAIPIAGISVHQMDHADLSGTSLRDFLLDLAPVLRIERTPATPTLGKWLVFTTASSQPSCEALLDDELSSAFREMLLSPEFSRFPTPTRLPTISPPVEYIAAIMADADSNLNLGSDDDLDDHTTLQPPSGNAWHRGPPKHAEGTSTGSTTTMTRTLAPTVATHIDELKTLMAVQQQTFNSRIASLETLQKDFIQSQKESHANMDKRFTDILATQLDTLIEKALPRITARMDEQINDYFRQSQKRSHPPSSTSSPALSSTASSHPLGHLPTPLPPNMPHHSLLTHPMHPGPFLYGRPPYPGPYFPPQSHQFPSSEPMHPSQHQPFPTPQFHTPPLPHSQPPHPPQPHPPPLPTHFQLQSQPQPPSQDDQSMSQQHSMLPMPTEPSASPSPLPPGHLAPGQQ
jgi:hypothetical protein